LVDRNAVLHLDKLTRLVADIKMVHVFSAIKCLLATDPKWTSQKFISNHIQKMLRKRLFDDSDQSGHQRLQPVSRQTSPLADSVSEIISFSTEKAWLVQSPMGHLSLSSSIELSNEAFVTVSNLQLGVPIPHMVIINQAIANKDMDIWGDQVFNELAWAGPSRKLTHDRIAQVLAGCMSWAGFPTYANEKKGPHFACATWSPTIA